MLKGRVAKVICASIVAVTLTVHQPARANITGGLGGGPGQSREEVRALVNALMTSGAIFFVTALLQYILDGRLPGSLLAPFLGRQAALGDEARFAYASDYGAARRMPLKAPYHPAYDWSGFYVGAHLGWGFGVNEWRDTFGDLAAIPGGTLTVPTDGFLGGLQAGINYQSGRWVVGLEGEISWSAIKDDVTVSLPPAVGTFQSETDWIASVAARFGYVLDIGAGRSWLIYAKGGAAFADYAHSFVLQGPGGPFIFPSQSHTATGWIIGGGLEASFGGNWSLKSEYAYYDFGSDRYTFSDPGFGTVRMDIDQQIHVAKFGLNYRFGGLGKTPIAAKY